MDLGKPVGLYILEGEIFRPAVSWEEYGIFRKDKSNWILAKDYLIPTMARVSTVFLCDDMANDDETPILFESMIFSHCRLNEWCSRYHTYEAAMTGHRKYVEVLRASLHSHHIHTLKEDH